jgi:hypothetical protein
MSRIWDIPEAEGVFSEQGITRPLASSSRLIADVSLMVRLAVVFGVSAASAIANTPVLFDNLGATSNVRLVIERSPVPARKRPERERHQGVDFSRARSAQQLAQSFQGMFRPATDIDDSPDDGFVFR